MFECPLDQKKKNTKKKKKNRETELSSETETSCTKKVLEKCFGFVQ